MKNRVVRFFFCTLVGLAIDGANSAEAARLFGDTFESGTAGAAIGAPWGFIANAGAGTSQYQTASNPFASGPFGGTTYGDLIDASSTNGQVRLLSNAGADTSLVSSLNGQVTTMSFDFDDIADQAGQPTTSQGLIAGYYRQQANPDLNGAGRSYSLFLHNGNASNTGVATAVPAYSLNTVNTVFMFVNDSASTVTNYAGSGHNLAATTEDVWMSNNGGSPIYLFSTPKQNTANPTVAGTGFRTFTGDIEHFQVDNFLVASGATFDRSSLAAFPTFTLNRTTGQLIASNASSFPVTIKGYSISSAAGSLVPGSWNSIADHSDADSGGSFDATGVWSKSSSISTQLTESTAGNGGLLAVNGGGLNLGNLWARTPYQDLVATYTLSDGSVGTSPIIYTGTAPVRSDLNGDGVVNAADWSLLLAGSGASFTGQTKVQAYQQGDVDGDLDNDFADFRLFKTDYDAINGQGAFNAMLQGVPEPSTVVLIAIGIAGLVSARRHPKSSLVILTLISATASFGHAAMAATPITYKASGDPALFPDSNAQVDDAWFTSIPAASGSGFFGFPANGIPDNHWILFSTQSAGVNGSIQADHSFDTPLSAGQAVSLDFANSSVAVAAGSNPNGVVGVSLTSGGTPVATFKFTGGDTLYRYDDAGVSNQSTGQAFAFRSLSSLEFRIDSATGYTAAYGNANGSSVWSGTTTGPIDGIRVFNSAGGNGSDVIFDNLTVGATTIVPLTLEVNKSTGEIKIKGDTSLAASIDYYQITSAANGLNFTPGTGANQWNSLDRQNLNAVDGSDPGSVAGDSPTEGWDQATDASKGRLAEYFLRTGGSAVPTNGALSIGRAFDNSAFGGADGDLLFSYGVVGTSRLMSGLVTYIGSAPGVIGDYNGNGVVDAADYVVWRDHLGQVFALQNRDPANGAGAISAADYSSWRSHFGASGSGAAVAVSGSVPEPSSSLLLLFGVGGLLMRRSQPRTTRASDDLQ